MSKPQYKTLVKALDELCKQVEHYAITSHRGGTNEVRHSYVKLCRLTAATGIIVARAKAAMAEKAQKRADPLSEERK